ncbi:MAG: metallophosphoesterase [Bacteroidia bacterium]|nr:metallophosphoesterase [Bacteroidia bacterium]
MRKFLIVLTCALSLACASASAQRLVIIHVNDTHSHLDPERNGNQKGKGGIIERAAYIDSLRTAVGKKNVLLLHAGDWDQGTPYFTVFGGNLEVSLINALEYDCLTFGNHEFDNGIEDLAARVKKIKAPVVCANYDFSSFDMGGQAKPYTIIKRGGLKIGIIGMLTDITTVVARSTADRIPRAGKDADVINKWASFLKDEKKCDMVIVLSHMGYDEDVAVTPDIRNVDLIVGGHSHTVLKDFTYVDDKDGKKVPIIQDGSWGLSLGRIDVY